MDRIGFDILTKKELEVLALWACNQSVKESAKCLTLSDRTIEHYRDRIRCKFQVMSSNELLFSLLFHEDYHDLINAGKQLLLNKKNKEYLFVSKDNTDMWSIHSTI